MMAVCDSTFPYRFLPPVCPVLLPVTRHVQTLDILSAQVLRYSTQRGRGAASAASSGSWSSDALIASPNIAEELQGLAAKGLTAPLARRSQSKQVLL